MPNTPTPKIISKKHKARMERENSQTRILLYASIAIFVIILGVIGYGILDQNYLQYVRPVAKVDGVTITVQQYQSRVRYARSQLVSQYDYMIQLATMLNVDPNTNAYFSNSINQIKAQLDTPAVIGGQVLDQMIGEIVIQDQAKKMGITVSDAEVEVRLQNEFGFYANGTPTPTITPTEVTNSTLSPTQLAIITETPTATLVITSTPAPTSTATLAPTNVPNQPTATIAPTETPVPTSTPYTLQGYQTQLKTYVDSLSKIKFTEVELRDIVRNEIFHDKVFAAVTKDTSNHEEQVWARHILVADEATAQKVLARLKAGEDWNKVCSDMSTDTGSKDTGGDLGWFGRGKMLVDFENAAFSLPIGKISDPVKSTVGFHIIQVLGHEDRTLNATDYATLKTTTFTNWLTQKKTEANPTKYNLWQTAAPTDPVIAAVAQ